MGCNLNWIQNEFLASKILVNISDPDARPGRQHREVSVTKLKPPPTVNLGDASCAVIT